MAKIQCDPRSHFPRTVDLFNDHNIQREPDAFDRLLILLAVIFASPHLLFGAVIWAYVAYWLLAVSVF